MTTHASLGSASRLRRYAQVGVQTGVESASPHRLILMLMDGALARIANAIGMTQRGDLAGKGENISLAIAIINGLRDSLNLSQGGEVAANLNELYRYMCERLLHANLKKDVAALREVRALLTEIRLGWAAIEPQASAQTPMHTTG